MSLLKKSGAAFLAIWIAGSISPLDARERHWDDGFRVYQDQAPNFIQVEIINVSVSSNKTLWFASSSDRVEIEARILRVFRTEDNLAPGMMIPILYDRKAAAGGTFAETPGIPERGSVGPAFIKRKGDYFIPAARHHTFSPLTDVQVARLKEKPQFLDPEQIAALEQPDAVLEAARIDSASRLPLKKTNLPEEPAPRAEIAESATPEPAPSAPLSPEQGEAIAPVETVEPDETAVAITPAPDEPEASPEVPRSVLSPMPNLDPPDPEKRSEARRRTVVVVPPSEIRAKREAEQSMPAILKQPEPKPVINEPQIETVSQQPSSPSIALPKPEVPAPRAAVVEALAPEVSPPREPEVRSTIPAFTVREPESPVVRAEPVTLPQPAPQPVPALQPEIAEIQPIAEPVPTTPAPELESMPEQVLNEASTQLTGAPAPPVEVEEEPIAITNFSPSPATQPLKPQPAPEPAPSVGLSATDQENMKSYADIYGLLQQAESAKASKKLEESKVLYEEALSGLQSMKESFPDFQPFMVEYRIRDTGRKLEQVMMQINRNPDTESQPVQP